MLSIKCYVWCMVPRIGRTLVVSIKRCMSNCYGEKTNRPTSYHPPGNWFVLGVFIFIHMLSPWNMIPFQLDCKGQNKIVYVILTSTRGDTAYL